MGPLVLWPCMSDSAAGRQGYVFMEDITMEAVSSVTSNGSRHPRMKCYLKSRLASGRDQCTRMLSKVKQQEMNKAK